MKSWRTTVAGLGTVMVAIGGALNAMFDGNAATNPDWTATIAAITAALGLLFARDNKVSSEDVGAK